MHFQQLPSCIHLLCIHWTVQSESLSTFQYNIQVIVIIVMKARRSPILIISHPHVNVLWYQVSHKCRTGWKVRLQNFHEWRHQIWSTI